MKQYDICVLGSLNIDLTVRMERFHVPGETVTGRSFNTFTGGKGGNQAVASARLGGKTAMIACLGEDANGKMYRDVMARENVDCSGIRSLTEETSGVAVIEVDDQGENRIVIVPGANARVDAAMAVEEKSLIENSVCLLMQLETPLEGVIEAAKIAHEAGTKVILDPAPARPLPDDLLALCDFVTPNETELATLTGLPVESDEQAVTACRALIEKGVRKVLHKRGARGALLVSAETAVPVKGFKVKAIDTTAAGDTFNAGFAVGLARGLDETEAIRLANAAGAISTTALGAQPAMPTLKQAEDLMSRQDR